MRAGKWSAVKLLGLTILGAITILGIPQGQAQSSPSLTVLGTRVSPGELLVITADKDNTFDLQADKNVVLFRVGKNDLRPEPARSVSPDGRAIQVLVPAQAQSGEVTVKARDTQIGGLTLAITAPSRQNRLGLLMAGFPVVFFAIFLFWLGYSLKKDSNWKLSEALSEQIERKVLLRDAQGAPVYHQTSHDLLYESQPIYTSSASRLIAFVGLFVITTGILSVLVPASYRFACTGEVPDLSNYTTFILAQAGIFAPYIVSKFTGMAGKPPAPPPAS